MRARALGISGVNFCPGIRVLQFLTKKKSEKSDLLAENFQFWRSKSHENLPSH